MFTSTSKYSDKISCKNTATKTVGLVVISHQQRINGIKTMSILIVIRVTITYFCPRLYETTQRKIIASYRNLAFTVLPPILLIYKMVPPDLAQQVCMA